MNAKFAKLYIVSTTDKNHFDAYYKTRSAKYWATTFYKETEKSRREMLTSQKQNRKR